MISPKHFQAFVDGKFVDTEKKLEIYSPELKEVVGTVPSLNKEQIKEAFLSAKKAFKGWSELEPDIRSKYLLALAEKMKMHIEDITNLLVLEIAKPFNESKVEVQRSIDYIVETVFAYKDMLEPIQYNHGTDLLMPQNKAAAYRRIPLGVALTISPFNYPINLMISKIAPALLMGNAVVHKSATQGSLTGAYIASLVAEIRVDGKPLPPGVFNYVTGRGSEIGEDLISNPNIDVASFTGSTVTGKKLASHMVMKPYILELGGKDAAIVLDDANMDEVAKEIVKGAYSYSGQRCTAIKRVIVDQSVADLLAQKILALVNKLTVGKAADNANITALTDPGSVTLAKKLYDDAIAKKAVSLTGPFKTEGNIVYPILLDYVTAEMDVAWIEPFAPILPIIRYKNVLEAIALNNQSDYGLQASIFGTDHDKIMEIAQKLDVGTVNVNASSSRGPDVLPFSGVKNSGFGMQGIKPALESFSRLTGIVLNQPKK